MFFRKAEKAESVHNQRTYERIRMVLGMVCRQRGEDFNIFTDDVSLGGIRFVSQHPVTKDHGVTLVASLHGGPLSMRGKVAWLNEERNAFSGGISFDRMDERTRGAWRDFIERNRQDHTSPTPI